MIKVAIMTVIHAELHEDLDLTRPLGDVAESVAALVIQSLEYLAEQDDTYKLSFETRSITFEQARVGLAKSEDE